ncbi:hypothetical protein ACKVMT_09970 [Halobacteriales archaeon Cl-PHB]
MSGDTDTDDQTEAANEEEERPPIEADERADVDLSEIADEIEQETNEQAAEASENGDDGEGESEGEGPPLDAPAGDDQPETPTESWGDQYVMLLAVLLEALVDELNDDGEEPGKDAEAIEALAKQPPVQLDRHVDRALEQMGGGTEVSPGKAIMLGTGAIALIVLLTETDLASDALAEVTDNIDL